MNKWHLDTITDKLESAVYTSPADKAKIFLNDKAFNIISLEENAELKVSQGPQTHITRRYNIVQENAIYVPKGESFLTRYSPIWDSIEKAVKVHSSEEEFYLTNEQVEKAREDSVKLPKISETFETKFFEEIELTNWAYGNTNNKKARIYGNFLYEIGTKKMPLWIIPQEEVDNYEMPFARPVWLGGLLPGKSALGANDRDLHFDLRIRGIKILKSPTSCILPQL